MSASPLDDRLMELAAGGCARSFEHLVRRHQDPLFRFFRSLGLTAHDAEDCVQETLLRLLRASSRWKARAPLQAFLMLLARHSYADWCRRRLARRQPSVPIEGQSEAAQADPAVKHAECLDLHQAITGLPRRARAVVELGLSEGLNYREIGIRLGIPEGTVKSRMFHAVRRLREAMQGETAL